MFTHQHLIIKQILLTILAATTSTMPSSRGHTLQKRLPIIFTAYSGADCVAAGPAGTPGFWEINMIYGTDYAKVIRSYTLSRNLLPTEQLDFSTQYRNSGAAITQDIHTIDNVTSCAHYDYSAYASTTEEGAGGPGVSNGRTKGCYTIESPWLFEQCVRIILVNGCPVGVCEGEVESGATNGRPALREGNGAASLSPAGFAEGVIH